MWRDHSPLFRMLRIYEIKRAVNALSDPSDLSVLVVAPSTVPP
jgi:hypothetical protein